MAKYKPTNPAQGRFLPVFFNKQLQKGTFEFAINHIIDVDLNLSHLDNRYQNDETGAPAYDPRILLKEILPDAVKRMSSSWLYLPTAGLISPPLRTLFLAWIKR